MSTPNIKLRMPDGFEYRADIGEFRAIVSPKTGITIVLTEDVVERLQAMTKRKAQIAREELWEHPGSLYMVD